jgi:hypothetical protein
MSLYDLLERLCIFSDFSAISKPPVELELGFADVAQIIATLGSFLIRFTSCRQLSLVPADSLVPQCQASPTRPDSPHCWYFHR